MEDKIMETNVTTAIMTLLTSTSLMKRNKLRKLVCNKFCSGVSWTDFQAVVDMLEGRGTLQQVDTGDGTFEVGLKGALEVGGVKGGEEKKNEDGEGTAKPGTKNNNHGNDVPSPRPPAAPLSFDVKCTEKIPTMVARHLTKQGGKKKTNIETNTKTRLTIKGDFFKNEGGVVDLIIEGESDKRINAAMVFVEKFRVAYGKNPERFDPNAVRQKREGGREGEGGEDGGRKKRNRKFY